MNEFIGGFLVLCFVLYAATGGADFGAGILELFARGKTREQQKEIITHAIAPVWEANHIWLVIAVVILFMGYPFLFSQVSVRFHIPLTFMLTGIVTRGCAFAFRQYDAKKDSSEKYYSMMFVAGSLMAPFAQGVVVGGLLLLQERSSGSFYEMFLSPWAAFGPLTLGLFVCALYAWIAAVYLVGECETESLRQIFSRRTWQAAVAALMLLLVTFPVFWNTLAVHPVVQSGVVAVGLGMVIISPAVKRLHAIHFMLPRLGAGAVSTLAVLTWVTAQFLVFSNQTLLAPAPVSTQRQLVFALCAATVLVVPALIYLLGIFKRPVNPEIS